MGKTTLVNRLRHQPFSPNYISTVGAEVHPICIPNTTNAAESSPTDNYTIWDCAGQEMFGGKYGGYCEGADVAMVMCDISSKLSQTHVLKWIRLVKQTTPNIQILVIVSKNELNNSYPGYIQSILPANTPVVYCSPKTDTGMADIFKRL